MTTKNPGQIVANLPPLDPNRRYPIPAALAYLDISKGYFYQKVRRGELRLIHDGCRAFVPGSELIAQSRVAA